MSYPYASQYYSTSGTLPMPVPTGKGQYPGYYQSDGTYSVSPPELDASVSSGSGVPSYSAGYSTTASYAGSSHGDYDSAGSVSGVDLNDYMHERFADTFDPIPLDKCVAVQAQTSGHLNAKQRQVLEMQAKAQARLAKSRARFAEGAQHAREVRNDLEYVQKKVSSTMTKASKKHPKEYGKARERYPSPEY